MGKRRDAAMGRSVGLSMLFVALAACGTSSSSSAGTDGGGSADGAAAGDSATFGDGGSCSDQFFAALDKTCSGNADCILVDHSDCCGIVKVGIRVGTQASFTTA